MDLKSLNFTQGAPSTTWTVTHGFVGKPEVDVMVTVDGKVQKIYPKTIIHSADGVLTISFSEPVTGSVRLVGVIAGVRSHSTMSYFEPDNV